MHLLGRTGVGEFHLIKQKRNPRTFYYFHDLVDFALSTRWVGGWREEGRGAASSSLSK